MAEDNNKEISRRDFLKKAGNYIKAVGLGSVLGTVVSNEIDKGINGIKTNVGTFIPLYEKHTTGIEKEDIPLDTKIFFREFAISNPNDPAHLLKISPTEAIFSEGEGYNGVYKTTVRAFPDEVLNTIASINAEIMIGDVIPPDYARSDKGLADLFHFYQAIAISGSGLLLASSIPEKPSKISRRKLLKYGGYAALGFGSSNIGANLLGQLTLNEGKQQNALKRIIARIEGMIFDFHPEDSNVFFRNAIMAYKMLKIAESHKDLPKVSFQVEDGHSGIEDFLQLGALATRSIILAYPKSFLADCIQANGGIENFCTSLLIKMPTNFEAAKGKANYETSNLITERKVVDQELKEGLEKILQ